MLTPARAVAHEFQIHPLAPTDDWCAEAHRVAVPGDVLQLLAGTYPGGCDLTLGGEIELNEALAVQGDPGGGTVIDADAQGISLRISGEPTRLYQLTLLGTLQIAASNTTIDRSEVACLDVDPGLAKITVLFSVIDELDVATESAVLRGNQLGSVLVASTEGLVTENTVHGRLEAHVPVTRNLVLGDLVAHGSATGNVVFGDTTAASGLIHNTLLGAVDAADTATNNLTIVAELPAKGQNLRCSDCLVDVDALDLQPRGEALDVLPLPTDPAVTDYCGATAATVGAVSIVGDGWTAHDRDIFGCWPGLLEQAPPRPEGWCPDVLPDTGTWGGTPPTGKIELASGDSSGCHTTGVMPSWSNLVARRRTP